MPALSICMATYNGMPYLMAQVDSILRQMGPDDELVVSDHGSTDGTQAFFLEIQDARIQFHPFLGPRGPVANFGNAIVHATRPVIVLVDQDDLWLPNRLSILRYAFSSSHALPLCLVTDGQRIDKDGQIIHSSNLTALKFRTGFWANIYRNSYMGCCMAFDRSLVPLILPFPNKIPMHDSWIGILAEFFGVVKISYEISYQYRLHGNNLSQKKNLFSQKIAYRVCLLGYLILRMAKWQLRSFAATITRRHRD